MRKILFLLLVFVFSIFYLLFYYLPMQGKSHSFSTNTRTFIDVEQLQVMYKANRLVEEGLKSYLYAVELSSQEYYDNALKHYKMAAASLSHAYSNDSNVIAYINPKIKKSIIEMEINKLKPGREVLEELNTLSKEIVEQTQRFEALTWSNIQKKYLNDENDKAHREIVYNMVIAIAFISLIVVSLIVRVLQKQKYALARANEELKLATEVFSSANEGILVTDERASIITANHTLSDLTGYSNEELLGKNLRILKSGLHDKDFYKQMWYELKKHGVWKGELWNKRKDGSLYAQRTTISRVLGHDNKVLKYIGLFSDITELKIHQEKLQYLAHYDALTKFPNRILLDDRLDKAMLDVELKSSRLEVIYIDLDGFKSINDTYGHDVGDLYLVHLVTNIQKVLNDSDTLARVGGDEFIVVIHDNNEDQEDYQPIVKHILEEVKKPMQYGKFFLETTASIGVAKYTQEMSLTKEELIRQADQAMYDAKRSGKNRVHVFDLNKDKQIRTKKQNQQRFQKALEDNELVLYYQPKVLTTTNKVTGVEALIRWNNPDYGLLTPNDFLYDMIDTEYEVLLGEWVLTKAMIQLKKWAEAEESNTISISVNIGPYHLQKTNFYEYLKQLLDDFSSVDPAYLEIEILESGYLEDYTNIHMLISECSKLGVKFAIDDFGTGSSSIAHLKRLPVEILKIDQSFIKDMVNDIEDLTIVESTINLGKTFQKVIVAEGVETFEHFKMLTIMGCDIIQGYYIAKPMPISEFERWRAEWQIHSQETQYECSGALREHKIALLYGILEHKLWVERVVKSLENPFEAMTQIPENRNGFLEMLGSLEYLDKDRSNKVYDLYELVHLEAEKLKSQKIITQEEYGSFVQKSKNFLEAVEALLED